MADIYIKQLRRRLFLMNVQFSFSASSTPNINGTATTQQDQAQAQSTGQPSNITDIDQMKKLEMQGMSLPIGQEALIRRIDQAMKALEGPETMLQVSVHKPTNSIMVKVLNKDTGELIREVPPEKTLDLVAKMMEIAGIIVDKRV